MKELTIEPCVTPMVIADPDDMRPLDPIIQISCKYDLRGMRTRLAIPYW